MKKTAKVISAILSTAIAVSASAAVAVSACASQYTYSENHNRISCTNGYVDNGKAVYSVKASKGAHTSASVKVKSITGGYMDMNKEIALKADTDTTDANVTVTYQGSDEAFDYFNITVDNNNGGVRYYAVNLTAYWSQYGEKAKDTNNGIGQTADGAGYELKF